MLAETTGISNAGTGRRPGEAAGGNIGLPASSGSSKWVSAMWGILSLRG